MSKHEYYRTACSLIRDGHAAFVSAIIESPSPQMRPVHIALLRLALRNAA